MAYDEISKRVYSRGPNMLLLCKKPGNKSTRPYGAFKLLFFFFNKPKKFHGRTDKVKKNLGNPISLVNN